MNAHTKHPRVAAIVELRPGATLAELATVLAELEARGLVERVTLAPAPLAKAHPRPAATASRKKAGGA